ncbi:MAG TPA: hypothetical protein VGL76_08695 [Gaiellaceae bacterium]
MTELEHSLAALQVGWPPTPDVASKLELDPRHARNRPLLVLCAATAVAIVAAFAVPDSRSAILRFFHLRGVTVELVQTLPSAQERPLSTGLGNPVDDRDATTLLGASFVPAHHGPLYASEGAVSTLLAVPQPALLTEFGNAFMLKKLANGAPVSVEVVPGSPGLWIVGQHVVVFPGASPRLAGNVLLWTRGNVTFRLEARGLDETSALELAREIMGTDSG